MPQFRQKTYTMNSIFLFYFKMRLKYESKEVPPCKSAPFFWPRLASNMIHLIFLDRESHSKNFQKYHPSKLTI